MTSCPKWKHNLLDLALGGCGASELEAHLKVCSACSAALDELRTRRERIDDALPKLIQGVEPSAAFRARLMALAENPPPRAWPLRAGLPVAFALVVVFAVWLVSPSPRRVEHKQRDKVLLAGQRLGNWQSPTRFLLDSSADELLRSVPSLGNPFIRIQPTALKIARSEKRKG